MGTENRLKGYDPITLESFTRHMTKHREPYDQYDMGYVDAVEQIENFLEYNTVDAVEVVHGQWEPELMPTGVEYTGCAEMTVQALSCSVCGKCVDVSEGYFLYCPNCGAKMDGDGNA